MTKGSVLVPISALLMLSFVFQDSDLFASEVENSASKQDHDPPTIVHQPITKAVRDRPLRVEAKITDPSGVFAPSVYVRSVGSAQYLNLPMKAQGDVFVATIPAEVVTGNLEYFIEAFDREGNGPAQEGAPGRPLEVLVEASASLASGGSDLPRVASTSTSTASVLLPPSSDAAASGAGKGGIETKWWFWTIIAVAVTGGTAAAIAVASSGKAEPVDSVVLVVSGPDPVPKF